MVNFGVAIARLALALALGAIVGWERERERKPAGLQDFALISFGAAMFIVVGFAVSSPSGVDPLRIVPSVVTGVGFLGAGSILREGGSIVGLTTAAAIWATASVGVAAGLGLYAMALAGTAAIWLVLRILGLVEDRLEGKK